MMWFFAVLVVLALGGVAAVAAGRGQPMAVEYDDRPDVTVPADQPLVEADVRRVRFSTALLGYRQSEVDALLERLARELGDRVERESEREDEIRAEVADEIRAELEPTPPPPDAPTEDLTTRPAPTTVTPAAARSPWWSRRRAGSPPRSE